MLPLRLPHGFPEPAHSRRLVIDGAGIGCSGISPKT
jgi:hypothetical protein